MTSSTIPHPPIVSRDEWLADHNIDDFDLWRRYPVTQPNAGILDDDRGAQATGGYEGRKISRSGFMLCRG